MKHRPYLLFIVFFVSFSLHGIAKNLNGSYVNNSGLTILEIIGDSLVIKSLYFGLDTVAICNIKEIDGSFIEINTLGHPFQRAFKDMTIIRTKQAYTDSISHTQIRFMLPNTSEEMDITVHCATQSYKGRTQNGVCQISLDRNNSRFAKPIWFGIEPLYFNGSNMEGQYFGIVYLPHQLDIKYELNDLISIELPSVTPELFYQYYIKGEYIQIIEDGLKWRGETYYRQ